MVLLLGLLFLLAPLPHGDCAQELATGRPIPASRSACTDNCSNCSCWITSVFASSSPAAESIIRAAISGAESSSSGPAEAESGWLWPPKTKLPHQAAPAERCVAGVVRSKARARDGFQRAGWTRGHANVGFPAFS